MENVEFKAPQNNTKSNRVLSKIPRVLRSPKAIIYLLLLVSLPTSVLLVKTVQDIRQRASGLPATPPTPPIPPTVGFGKALSFLNIGTVSQMQNYFKTNPSDSLKLTPPYTIEGWFRYVLPNPPANEFPSVLWGRSSGTAHQFDQKFDDKLGLEITQLYDPAKSPRIAYTLPDTLPATFGSSKVYPDGWNHIAVTASNNEVKIFLNGKLDGSSNKILPTITNPTQFFIGKSHEAPNTYASFGGYTVDEVRISKSIRYKEDFIPSSTPFNPDSDTISLWHFDGNVDDATGFNNGIINGSLSYIDSKIYSTTPTPQPSTSPTCTPRPTCLDSQPKCYIPELESYCPPTITSVPGRTTPTPTPQIYTCGSPCSSNSQCSGICSSCSQGKCTVPPTPTYILTPTPTPALYPDLTIDLTTGGGLSTSWQVGSLSNPVNVKFRIINQGSVPASAQYIYTNQSEGYSTLAPDNTCTASTILSPGKSCVSSYNFVFKSYGTKYFTISIDPYNQIKESIESNNIFDTKVLLFQMSPTPPYGTPPVTPKPTLQPTPAPKMCPASLSSIKLLDSCRYLFFSKGSRGIDYICSDKYKGKIRMSSCTSTAELTKQASAACAKRKTYCTK